MQVAKAAPAEDETVDYPYNQDHGSLVENYEMLDNNGLWKEASEDADEGNEEDLGLIVDYPYNQLFGQDTSEFPVLTGYYENAPQRATENASSSTPVEHTVHSVEFPDFDVVDLASPPPPTPAASRHHIYHSYPVAPAAPASPGRQQQQQQQPRRIPVQQPTAVTPSKIDDRLMAEINLEKTRFVPVSAALVGERQQQPAGRSGSESRGVGVSTESNVGDRRHELAKEGVDSMDYVESFANIQLAPDDKFVFSPTGQTTRCGRGVVALNN